MSKKSKLEEQVNPELLKELQEMQAEMKKKLILLDEKNKYDETKLKYIGAMDISFSTKKPDIAYAVIAVFDYSHFDTTKEIVTELNKGNKKKIKKIDPVYTDCIQVTMNFPYIPGMLAIREVPHYIKLLERLKTSKPEYYPNLLLVDGNGILHCHEFGCACYLGVSLGDMPTIGCSKTFFNIDGLQESDARESFMKNCINMGDSVKIVGKSTKIWGASLKTTSEKNSKTCMYISVGHMMDLDSALNIVKKVCVYGNPEPIRHADLMGREAIRKYEKELEKNKVISDA